MDGGAEVLLDVRDDIRSGREPFGRIMAAVRGLGPDQVLLLRVPFEPVPLYRVLGRQGFSHRTECRAPDDWWVRFSRAEPDDPASPGASTTAPTGPAGVVRLDVRGLEPPLPMVQVLEALERLEAGQHLEVLHERRPLFLYPQLDERGFVHETDEPEPGLVRILIRRGGAP
jgi:uncharacterized protein (DUF2249 family)